MGSTFGLASGVGIRFLSTVLFLLLLGASIASAQRSNLERLQLCARSIADSVIARYHGGDTVRLRVVEHPASWLLDAQMLDHAESRGIGVSGGDVADVTTVAILGVGIELRETEESDRLQRTASMAVSTTGPAAPGSGSARMSREFVSSIIDTIDAAQAVALESPGYPFSRGIIISGGAPGFWEKIVEPVVILGASVVMVILLFPVRSQ